MNIIKSKSSNPAIQKTEEGRKKSWSHSQFQPLAIKQRGLYVNRFHKVHTEENADTEPKHKIPARPKPGQKQFLASVLTILSKVTAGTQFPEEDSEEIQIPKRVIRRKKEEKKHQQKKKYRSRILNDELSRVEKDQMIVLQPKKDLIHTPSNASAPGKHSSDIVKCSETSPDKNVIKDILENNIYSGVAEGRAKDVLDDEKVTFNDDPHTVAAEIANNDDKKMYNFFVDLLKTTISVYNVQADYGKAESQVALEINQSIADKLTVNPSRGNSNTSHAFNYNSLDAVEFNVQDTVNIKRKRDETKSETCRVKAKSFAYDPKIKTVPKSVSVNAVKKISKSTRKKEFMNIFKQQLMMDDCYEEPRTLFDTLKIMVKNKRRNEKTTHFYDKVYEDADCMLKCQNAIFPKKSKKTKILNEYEKVGPKNINTIYGNDNSSSLSLAVYGFDYEGKPIDNVDPNRLSPIIIDQEIFDSEFNFDPNSFLRNTVDSDYSND